MVSQEDHLEGKCVRILMDLLDNSYTCLRDRHMQGNIIYNPNLKGLMSVNTFAARYMNHLIIQINPDILECSDEILTGGIAHELSHVVLFLEGDLDHSEEDATEDAKKRGYEAELNALTEWNKQKRS